MRRVVLSLLVVVVLAACSDGDDGSASDREATSMTKPTVAVDGPVGERIADVLAYVNDGRGDPTAIFAPSFLAEVPVAELDRLIRAELRPGGPHVVDEVIEQTETSAVVLVGAFRMSIAIEADAPHLVTGLLFRPESPELTSWADLEDRLRAAASTVSLLAAEIVDGRCQPIHALDSGRIQPLGSLFKLYVLAALDDAVRAGAVAWDDEVTIRDELRSQGSAELDGVETGTDLSVSGLATAMISVSDNTATDHLIDLIGRDEVFSAQSALGLADPGRNDPFLTAREASLLKWGVPAAVRDAYIAATPDERHRLLEELPAGGATEDALDFGAGRPVAVDQIEWFASADDLCRAHATLHERGAEVRRVLGVNAGSGISIDRETWPYVAFKGGSEPGVLAMAWLAERADGRVFVVAGLLQDDTGAIDSTVAVDVANAFDLLVDV